MHGPRPDVTPLTLVVGVLLHPWKLLRLDTGRLVKPTSRWRWTTTHHEQLRLKGEHPLQYTVCGNSYAGGDSTTAQRRLDSTAFGSDSTGFGSHFELPNKVFDGFWMILG